ncbi:hypothetical protein LguiB_024378 [Lonicera macranthoides]
MMSKKMKGVDLGSSPYGAYVDAKARFKHQTLMQEYQELHKETEATKGKLEIVKHKKLTLLAEVRFLRRRYKYLLKNKNTNPPQEREPVPQQNLETKRKSKVKGPIFNKKDVNLRKLLPIYSRIEKGRMYMGKEATFQNPTVNQNFKQKVTTLHSGKEANPIFDLNQRGCIYRGKEAAVRNPFAAVENQRKRMYVGNGAGLRNPGPVFDLNQKESVLGGKEAGFQSRPAVFDLNQISREEEEFEDNAAPLRFEESKKSAIRGGSDEPLNDLKLSVCRNVGDGPSRAGKRKISWQDPVALRV